MDGKSDHTGTALRAESSESDALLARLRACLAAGRAARAAARGDRDLNPDMERHGALAPAAVLVPVVAARDVPWVLFTKRALGLADHAGEISFPGGRIEAGDTDPVSAALRETEEELGVPRAGVEVLGALDDYETRTGFRVSPIVGIVRPPLVLRPDPREVAAVIQVPLAHLLDPANHRREEREAGGRIRRFHAIVYGEHVIWGATAGMIVNLCDWFKAG
jgi:8-oxo-dGTP pyrophosphatase MutT (NUDIX family)